jgi:uroporphyrinogen-III synthase
VQLHGEPLPDFVESLRAAGAHVIEVPVYRWIQPDDTAPLHRLVELAIARQVDAVSFTSAPAVASLLATSARCGRHDELVRALQEDVLAACVGPVTAAPLERLGVPTLQPERARLGSMVREIVATLPVRRRHMPVGGTSLQVRGHGALVGGVLRPLAPAPMAVLRALARKPGVVLSRTELVSALPGDSPDGHAVEMAVARLRAALGPRIVQTVVKRGYRLAYEPERPLL